MCSMGKSCFSRPISWMILSGILVLALIFQSGKIASLIPFLSFLICPLAMFFGMKVMGGQMKNHDKDHEQKDDSQNS